ncbi:MAG: class I SAM-dependent methyltransferase [Hyphomicrobiales bacterium]|nr:class I SAM-dependent methyltransferase [Hyphomicrobiales bacterium]
MGYALETLLRDFTQSDEYKTILGRSSFPMDGAPPMPVQTTCASDQRHAIWSHIASVWSEYGSREPYWSVVTDDRWRAANMSDERALDEFYRTGEAERERLDAWLRRNAVSCGSNAVCAEYGCGVGRVTFFLAGRFRSVIALDVSETHLEAARRRLRERNIRNVEYILVRDPDDLLPLTHVDIFYSILTLQHNPPPIIADILSCAFKGLNPGGAAFFQVPTYAKDYSFSVQRYLRETARNRVMEMHFLPQRTVLELARIHDVFPLEIQPDWCIGNPDRWISSTFLMTKRGLG